MASDDQSSISSSLKSAKMCEMFKRADKALEIYHGLMLSHPADFRAFFNCGRLLAEREEKLSEALLLFTRVLEIDGTVVDAYGAIAALLIKLHRPRDAAQYCEAGLSVRADDKACLYNINVALRQEGRIQRAITQSWNALSGARLGVTSRPPRQHAPVTVDLTVVCVKWGKKYGPEYVNNLSAAIRRNLPEGRKVSVVCFTDDTTGITTDVRCFSFAKETQSWQGWWLKAQVFDGSYSWDLRWVIYVDLDTVICNSLQFVFDLIDSQPTGTHDESCAAQTHFYTLSCGNFRNEARDEGMNSSLILWDTHRPELYVLYDFLVSDYERVRGVIYKFDHYLEMMLYAHTVCGPSVADSNNSSTQSNDDALQTELRSIQQQLPPEVAAQVASLPPLRCRYLQDECPGRVVDYFEADETFGTDTDLQRQEQKGLQAPEKEETGLLLPSVVCFPLKPKPHEVCETAWWVRKHWCTGTDHDVNTGNARNLGDAGSLK